jgi:murein DD-endopeptidase MepM/ murein hydrolase activator NlpD
MSKRYESTELIDKYLEDYGDDVSRLTALVCDKNPLQPSVSLGNVVARMPDRRTMLTGSLAAAVVAGTAMVPGAASTHAADMFGLRDGPDTSGHTLKLGAVKSFVSASPVAGRSSEQDILAGIVEDDATAGQQLTTLVSPRKGSAPLQQLAGKSDSSGQSALRQLASSSTPDVLSLVSPETELTAVTGIAASPIVVETKSFLEFLTTRATKFVDMLQGETIPDSSSSDSESDSGSGSESGGQSGRGNTGGSPAKNGTSAKPGTAKKPAIKERAYKPKASDTKLVVKPATKSKTHTSDMMLPVAGDPGKIEVLDRLDTDSPAPYPMTVIKAPKGTPVVAPKDMTVLAKRDSKSNRHTGSTVFAKLGDGTTLNFAGLKHGLDVKPGHKIKAGTPFGYVGTPKDSGGDESAVLMEHWPASIGGVELTNRPYCEDTDCAKLDPLDDLAGRVVVASQVYEENFNEKNPGKGRKQIKLAPGVIDATTPAKTAKDAVTGFVDLLDTTMDIETPPVTGDAVIAEQDLDSSADDTSSPSDAKPGKKKITDTQENGNGQDGSDDDAESPSTYGFTGKIKNTFENFFGSDSEQSADDRSLDDDGTDTGEETGSGDTSVGKPSKGKDKLTNGNAQSKDTKNDSSDNKAKADKGSPTGDPTLDQVLIIEETFKKQGVRPEVGVGVAIAESYYDIKENARNKNVPKHKSPIGAFQTTSGGRGGDYGNADKIRKARNAPDDKIAEIYPFEDQVEDAAKWAKDNTPAGMGMDTTDPDDLEIWAEKMQGVNQNGIDNAIYKDFDKKYLPDAKKMLKEAHEKAARNN